MMHIEVSCNACVTLRIPKYPRILGGTTFVSTEYYLGLILGNANALLEGNQCRISQCGLSLGCPEYPRFN